MSVEDDLEEDSSSEEISFYDFIKKASFKKSRSSEESDEKGNILFKLGKKTKDVKEGTNN